MTTETISLTESQNEFVQLCGECLNPLFVGGPGCGKSYLLGLVAVMYAMHSKDAKIYIYAPENHHIRTIEVPNVIYWLERFKIKHGGHNKHENAIYTDDPRCGDFYFKNMETAATLVGYESYISLIDELDTLDEGKAEEIYNAVVMRNRQQPDDVPDEHKVFDEQKNRLVCANRIMSFTTPEGYKFCYKNWELNQNPNYKQIKGRTEDNPALSSAYVEQLRERFPSHIADKYLVGEFVNMDSLAVYYNYDPDLHMSYENIQPGENLYVGCDFNKNNTAGVVFVKRNGSEWHAVHEYAGLRDSAELAHLLDVQFQRRGHKIYVYPDASGRSGNNSNNANLSAVQELESKGFVIRAPRRNFRIEDRTDSTNKAFSEGKIYVNMKNCPVTSRCLVNQPLDKNGKPCKKTGYDHQNDAFSYFIVFEMGPRQPMFHVPIKWMR